MPVAERSARTVWTGTTARGSGKLTVASGAFPEQTLTFAARTEQSNGLTSPEELIAAAHSACYAMALSAQLTRGGTPPRQLSVEAVCTLDRPAGAYSITTIALTVSGQVPGLDQAAFERAASEAEQTCPVSRALHGNVEIRLTAILEREPSPA
jgi:lipoyl-dependent peroxiredoxin